MSHLSLVAPAEVPRPWSLKARWGHPLHRICAFQASFPPQLPAYFLDRYARSGAVVLDPFCGRGTTLLEASLRGCTAYGADLLPTAVLLSRVKLGCPSLTRVLDEISTVGWDDSAPDIPDWFRPIYHPQTWQQLWCLREADRSDALTALALGRLHGHSPGFFSATTFNVISIPSASFARQNAKHGTGPEARDVRAILERAARRFIPRGEMKNPGKVAQADARWLPWADASMDLIITSPPFLGMVDYPRVNWLREWFLRGRTSPVEAPFFTNDVAKYAQFLREGFASFARLLRPGGFCVMEVGNVHRKRSLLPLVLEASEAHFRLVEIVCNDFAGKHVPKISRAMVGGRETAVTQNQCVVLTR